MPNEHSFTPPRCILTMFRDEVVVVTGAASGIGRATALELAERGATIVVADVRRTPRGGGEPTDELIERGTFIETDVADPDAVRSLFRTIEDRYGQLDVLVNNAGIQAPDAPALELAVEDWEHVVGVNLTGTFLCCKYGLPGLLASSGGDADEGEGESARGRIVNMSSIAGLFGSAGNPAYCSSKAGVTNLTRQLAIDYGSRGLRSNAVHPGLIETELTRESLRSEKGQDLVDASPTGSIGEPIDVANAVVYLASNLARHVNGHALVVDGGLSSSYY
jgi:NAD(P)-dependent dehydrogenase (short-subunit alcohol dehydrogenase family)